MNNTTSKTIIVNVFAALLAAIGSATAAELPGGRVLAIGIDGVRPDALKAAKTPHLDALVNAGAFADDTQILGERYQKNNTISGPGWSSFLTGVWADKHGVHDNSFKGKNYDAYPHFFARVKSAFPDARTASIINWKPLDTHVVSHADLRKAVAVVDDDYEKADAEVARAASEHLAKEDPHAVMVYFGNVDVTGHRHGFHPSVKPYVAMIEKTDRHVGRLVEALKSRPDYEHENWLVLVSTDHGGRGRGHGDGQNVPEIRTTFLIVSGPAARRGEIERRTYVVDLPVTALVHMGVTIAPAWKLDGKPVGLK